VRSLDALDPLKQFSFSKIEHQHRFGVFWRREQPVSLEVNTKVIKVPLDRGRDCESLDETQRLTLGLSIYWRRFLSEHQF
jgi:hypothetical protein